MKEKIGQKSPPLGSSLNRTRWFLKLILQSLAFYALVNAFVSAFDWEMSFEFDASDPLKKRLLLRMGQIAQKCSPSTWVLEAMALGWILPTWGGSGFRFLQRQGLKEVLLWLSASCAFGLTLMFNFNWRSSLCRRLLSSGAYERFDLFWNELIGSPYLKWLLGFGYLLTLFLLSRTWLFRVKGRELAKSMQTDWKALEFPDWVVTFQYTVVLSWVAFLLACVISLFDWASLKFFTKFIFPWIGAHE